MLTELSAEYNLVRLEQTESTNTDAKRLAAEGCPHLTLVWAREQIGGRGRAGRIWHSPRGNLFWSVVLRPEKDWPSPITLGYVAAVAVGQTLLKYDGAAARMQYKWPNDVLLDGRKVAGILIEATSSNQRAGHSDGAESKYQFDWIVVGVGVNVAHYPEQAIYPTTSLKESLKQEVSLEEFMIRFSNMFLSRLNDWIEDGFEKIRAEFLERARGLGEMISIRLNQQEMTGRFLGIDGYGQLILDVNGTTSLVNTGDVFFR